MEIGAKEIVKFLIILLRTSIVMVLLPVTGSKNIPPLFKIGFIIAFSFLLTPVVDIKTSPLSEAYLSGLILSELIAGIVIGMVVRTVFIVAEMSGQIISNTMGLSMATVFDPEAGYSTEISRFFWILSFFVFFVTGVYREIIYIFARSFEIIPPGTLSFKAVPEEMIDMGNRLLRLSIKLSAGVVIVMMVTNIIMGFLSRSVPQMNVFFVAYPVYIGLGFLMIMISLPAYIYFFTSSFEGMKEELMRFLYLMRR